MPTFRIGSRPRAALAPGTTWSPRSPCRLLLRGKEKGGKFEFEIYSHIIHSLLTRRGHQSGEPEITELDDAELRDEDVLGLHVAVDDLKVSFSNEPIPIACPILLFSLFTSAFLPSFSLSESRPISFYQSRQSRLYISVVRALSACPNSNQAIARTEMPNKAFTIGCVSTALGCLLATGLSIHATYGLI